MKSKVKITTKKLIAVLLTLLIISSVLPSFTVSTSAESTNNFSLSAVIGYPNGYNGEGYTNLFDGDTGTKWCCDFSDSAHVIFKASEPVKVSKYSIATANDAVSNPGRNPVKWTLSACMNYTDETTSWTVIDTEDGGLPNKDKTYAYFDLAETTPFYQYFKLEITNINDGNILQISEIALEEYKLGEHQWEDTGETIAPTCTEGGYYVEYCPLCQGTRNVPINALGHNFVDGVCTRCDADESAPYQPIKDINGIYQIGTAQELYWFAGLVNGTLTGITQNTSAKAVLTADIIVNKDVLKADGTLNSGTFTDWTPIGNYSNQYTGKFDGQGHTISGLYFNNSSTSYVGLFGRIGSGGEIKNTGVIDSYISGKGCVGGVCGYNKTNSIITGCYNTGTVKGGGYVGGVCGWNEGSTITGCYNIGTVSGTNYYVGGVCGYNYQGKITGCYNTGTVSGTNFVGGVCGCNEGSTITGCYNIGTVSGSDESMYVGGVCGYNKTNSIITGCYNTGTVSGTNFVGGVCGYNGSSSKMSGCYNTGTVSGDSYVGGVCGYNYQGKITGCYTNNKDICGYNNGGTISSDCAEYNGNEFKDTTVCKLLNTTLQNANSDVRFYQGANYPEVISNVPNLVDSVYQISNKQELYAFAQLVNYAEPSASAVLTKDIVVNKNVLNSKGELNSGTFDVWTPIGNSSNQYTGKFDGQGHTISGLYLNNTSTSSVGLFGCLGENGEIKNVGVIDSYFRGYSYVGGVCGENKSGTITGCYNTGTVSSSYNYAGGVCGVNRNIITGSYNTGSVKGRSRVGGVSGWNGNSGTIIGCYNTGAVSSTNGYIGGVCGYNYTSIIGCYTNNKGICGYNEGGTISSDCAEYKGNEFKDGTVCGLLNTALKNANSDVRFYQGENLPEFIHAPQLVDGVYQISCAAELYWFAGLVNGTLTGITQNTSAKAVLTADIIVNKDVLKADGTLNSSTFTDWTPIGNYSNQYTGKFDGQGHTISGLYFNNSSTSCVGLFGRIGSGGEIKNVGVIDSYFKDYSYVGGVCGMNDGTITGCYNTGTVSGSDGAFYVGGVCGFNYSGTITGSYNTGTVSGDSSVGGVCGYNYKGIITGCYNTGTVSDSGRSVGGVCGYNSGGKITGCYNIGTVSGDSYVGGVCGFNDSGTITGCYTNNKDICGLNNGTVTNCDVKTDAEFKDTTVCKLLNTALQNANSDVHFYQGVNYPVLIIIPNLPKLVDDVYQISNEKELYAFAKLVNSYAEPSANAVLTADITVNNNLLSSLEFDEIGNVTNKDSFESWDPIGNGIDSYTGKFDGQGHAISGLYRDSNEIGAGLFKKLGSGGEIKNVGVIDSYFKGDLGIGGVCGINNGTITGCYNTGKVSGYDFVGGVCGMNEGGTITGCYNTGTVSGDSSVGGVCGYNSGGKITGCYTNNGGVCGDNKGTIIGCYTNSGGGLYEEFKNGTVCKDLNTALKNANSKVLFCQRIGTDVLPLLDYQVEEHTAIYTVENNTFKLACLCGKKDTKTMELTLITQKTVVASGADNTLTATLSNLDNEVVTYKWYQNGIEIEGATSSTYKMPTNLSVGTYTYRVDVTMEGVGTISQTVDVIVDITPQYYVEIPATNVNVGGSFTVSASNVLLKNNAQLKVSLESDFVLSNENGTLLKYEILTDNGKINSGDTLLTVTGSENPTAPGSGTSETYNVALAQGEKAKYSGNYTDTLTFTIKVEP